MKAQFLDSIIYGRGLFATEPIAKGEEILPAFKMQDGKILFNSPAGHINNSETPTAAPIVKPNGEVIIKALADLDKNSPITINYEQWNQELPAHFHIRPLTVKEMEKTQGGRINTIFFWSPVLLYFAFIKKKDEPLTKWEKGFFAFAAVTIFISCGIAYYNTQQQLKKVEK